MPVHPSVTVTNVGFSDVDYHSGEPFSMTDWTPTTASTSVSWATQTFAQNANANALRWGTMFNYSFEADAPPVVSSCQITLGLFRAGGPNSVGSIAITGLQVPGLGACVADTDDGSGTGTRDGGVANEDLLYYLAAFDTGDLRADVDNGTGTGTPDCGVAIEDLLYFLGRFDAGC